RRAAPQLPPRYEDPAELLPRLRDLAGRAPGAVALAGGRVAGFLTAYLLDRFRGRPGVFSPEWANAAAEGGSREIYEALYAELCRLWVADGRAAHGVALFADDGAASEAWRWLGFGLAAADGVRDLGPLAAPDPGLAIRRAGPADLAGLAALDAALHRHLMAAPVCLPLEPLRGHDELAAELADPAYAFWSAWDGDEAVGFMKFGPASLNACAVIVDPGTASITGAYTLPALRGRGVGAALLDRGLAWARAAGYTRCSVDFEPMNTPATRFWLAHFRLVCLAHVRLIDQSAAP
ncbi:MAG TPA: GNAT family N-acetyltransferase, partial [Chloroflexaceae bacterium]|nr:GNAT family N-acetyltransferase [Chloroflexaceae bacterium]